MYTNFLLALDSLRLGDVLVELGPFVVAIIVHEETDGVLVRHILQFLLGDRSSVRNSVRNLLAQVSNQIRRPLNEGTARDGAEGDLAFNRLTDICLHAW